MTEAIPVYPGTAPGQYVWLGGFWVPVSSISDQTPASDGAAIGQADPGTINSTATPQAQRQLTVAALDSVIPIPYGLNRMPALLANILQLGGDVVFWVIWGKGPIESIDSITMNDGPLPDGTLAVGGVTMRHYLGTQTQTVEPILHDAFAGIPGLPEFTETLPGIAYSVIWMDASLFTGPPQFNAIGKWKHVYDPRLDDTNGGAGPQRQDDETTWGFSRNGTCITADFLKSTEYGQGRIPDWPSVAACADLNDETVGDGSLAEPRRLCDMVIDREASIDSWVETLRTAAAIWLQPVGDITYFIPDRPVGSEKTYSHADRNILKVSGETMPAPRSQPTVVEIIYTNTTALPWTDTPVNPPAMLDGVPNIIPWRKLTVRMPWITRFSQAQREGIEWLNKLWLGAPTMILDVMDEGIQHQPGGVITLTYPDSGYDALLLRIKTITQTADGWQLECRKEDDAMYSDVVQSGPSTWAVDPGLLPSGTTLPPAPMSLSLMAA